jgi:hypothetical protein
MGGFTVAKTETTRKKEVSHEFEFVGRLIDILKILWEETDECTTISQPAILELLQEHEHSCSDKTLTANLKAIMKELNPEEEDGFVDDRYTIDDYKIIPRGLEEKLQDRSRGLKSGSKKLQIRALRYHHTFSFEELNQLVEAVLFLKNIDEATKEKLIRKIRGLSSKHFPEYSPFISATTGKISNSITSVYEDSRVDEAAVRKNLAVIRSAIEKKPSGCKIAFHFNGYDENKELVPRKRYGKPVTYVANPYYVILYNGKYYLICNVEPYDNVSIYRIDLMTDITTQTKSSDSQCERRKPKRDVDGLPQDWNETIASQFQTEHLYMYYGKAVPIRLKIPRDRYTLVHDYFGERYRLIRHLDDTFDEVEVTCVPEAMAAWAMQCSEYVEVLSPQELRKDIRKKCQNLLEKYRDDTD